MRHHTFRLSDATLFRMDELLASYKAGDNSRLWWERRNRTELIRALVDAEFERVEMVKTEKAQRELAEATSARPRVSKGKKARKSDGQPKKR